MSINKSIARNNQQKIHIIYQIAKTLTLYNIDEIIVFDVNKSYKNELINKKELENEINKPITTGKKIVFNDDDDFKSNEKQKEEKEQKEKMEKLKFSDDAYLLANILLFFITPRYLRNSIFPKSLKKELRYAKTLPRLPHLSTLSKDINHKYIQGISAPSQGINQFNIEQNETENENDKLKFTQYVNIGLSEALKLNEQLVSINTPVTIDLKTKKVVSAEVYGKDYNPPYKVRLEKEFSNIFTRASYKEGYTHTIWAPSSEFYSKDENNKNLPDLLNQNEKLSSNKEDEHHFLIVLGRWDDISEAIKSDSQLPAVDQPKDIFDRRIGVRKGSRTEDVLLAALSKMESSLAL